jgi:hypothetical protein
VNELVWSSPARDKWLFPLFQVEESDVYASKGELLIDRALQGHPQVRADLSQEVFASSVSWFLDNS